MMTMHQKITEREAEMVEKKKHNIPITEGVHQQDREDKLKYLQRMEKLLAKMDKGAKVANIAFGGTPLKKGTEEAKVQTVLGKIRTEKQRTIKALKLYEDYE